MSGDQHWPGEPTPAQMMDDLWNALHDSEHGHPASPDSPRACWEAMLDHVRKVRADRWATVAMRREG